METCIFCKIARHEIPKDFAYEDKDVMAFADINPIKEVHILIMPKEHIRDFLDIKDLPAGKAGKGLMDKLKNVGQKIIKEQKLEDKGYRIVVNGGGAQIIDHLHLHIIGPLGKSVKM
ncbi:MAG: HIT domain-containing protein [Patescibacteria group bacterium]